MYKNNSGFIDKTNVIKYNEGLCLNENLVHLIRYYSYTRPLAHILKQQRQNER
jgi:hypothetical protein